MLIYCVVSLHPFNAVESTVELFMFSISIADNGPSVKSDHN